ncbi:unnamed protein product, partial [Linum tenue]
MWPLAHKKKKKKKKGENGAKCAGHYAKRCCSQCGPAAHQPPTSPSPQAHPPPLKPAPHLHSRPRLACKSTAHLTPSGPTHSSRPARSGLHSAADQLSPPLDADSTAAAPQDAQHGPSRPQARVTTRHTT